MVVSVEQAMDEAAARAPNATTANVRPRIFVSPELHQAATAQAAASGGQTPPGINAQDFVAANRIHIKDGSLFIDPYLVLHPRELAPANDANLRKKLALTYSINNPSFFEGSDRAAIALNLGQLIPVSLASKHSKLLEEIKQFNTQVETGKDADLVRALEDKHAPFASIVRGVTEHPGNDPAGLELLKNSLGLYLLVREKLTQNGYLGKLNEYVQRNNTPDQVIADLSTRIGTTPLAFRTAALQGGLDGVGRLLGLDPLYVANVRELVEHASTQDFGYNLVEHWHLGRQLQGLQAPLKEKIAVGMDARITAKIAEYRNKVRHHFEVPEPVKKEEHRIAEALNLVEPIQRALMYKLGYEICFSPEVNADDIAFYHGIYGLHRKAANDLRDARGTYRIYFSGRGDLKGSMRTLVHEVAHDLWPEQFSPAAVAQIDQYAAGDQQRFIRFEKLIESHYSAFEQFFNAYKASKTDADRNAAVAATNAYFVNFDLHAEGLFPYLRDAHDFQFAVKHLYDTLQIEGERYNRSGYDSPQERFREVLSRFAELKQVEYRGEPQLLQFLAPGLNQIWENHYLPHLAKVYQALENGTIKPIYSSVTYRDIAEVPKIEERPVPQQQPPVNALAADGFVEPPFTTTSSIARLGVALPSFTNGVNVNR